MLLDEAETLSFLMEEVVNPRGTLEGLKVIATQEERTIHVGVRYHVGKHSITGKLNTRT